MNKALCFVIAIVITLLPLGALAEATATEAPPAEKQIDLFDVYTAPADEYIEYFKSLCTSLVGYPMTIKGGNAPFRICDLTKYSMFSTYTKDIPGYNVTLVPFGNASFLGLPVQSVNITAFPDDDIEHTALGDCHIVYIALEISIRQYSDREAIFNALTDKFTDLFKAEPQRFGDSSSYWTHCVWSFGEGRVFSLTAEWSAFSENTISGIEIRWFTTDAEKKMNALLDAVTAQIIEGLK